MDWIVDKEVELEPIALQLLKKYPNRRVFTFSGDLGSGKTTFIKYLCKALGAGGQATSPTFALVNEYATTDSGKIYHFDFYRIRNNSEAYDIGYEEYFYSGNYCFVEWPETIGSLVPQDAVNIHIEIENGKRHIHYS